jgi:polar amino acid transport system substrate-binding protein
MCARRRVHAVVSLIACAACGFPRDAEGTLDHIKGGTLRVGVADSRPWVNVADATISGPEVALVSALASEMHAKPLWTRGSEALLLKALHDHRLDVVIGGFTIDSPWKAQVAFTRPYEGGDKPRHVMATSPGENAWLVRLEEFLKARGPIMAASAREHDRDS